jgi:division protein CdvB (Snf7/Vps24/ESCRT-III family)
MNGQSTGLATEVVDIQLKLMAWGGERERKEGVKGRVVEAIRKLELHRKEVQILSRRLQERSNRIFESVLASLQAGEKDRANVYATENVEIKKVINVLRTAELALTQVILRLESIRDVGEAISEMEQAFGVIKGMGRVLEGMSVEMSVAQDNIQKTLTETMAELQQLAPDLRIDLQASNGEEIVEEALKYLEEQLVKQELPEPSGHLTGYDKLEEAKKNALLATSDTEEEEFKIDVVGTPKAPLEDQVSKYISSRGGKFDVYDTARAVGAPVDEVEKSVLKLVTEGKLKLEHREDGA